MSLHVTKSARFLFPLSQLSRIDVRSDLQPFSYYPHLYYCDYVSVLFSRIFLGHQENWFFHKDYFVERKRSWKSFSNVSLRLSEEAAKRVISRTKGKKRIAQETVNQRHEKFK